MDAVNDDPNPLLNQQILDLIQQNDGMLGWVKTAAAVGIGTMERRHECLRCLMLLEDSGLIRSEISNEGLRFLLVRPSE